MPEERADLVIVGAGSVEGSRIATDPIALPFPTEAAVGTAAR